MSYAEVFLFGPHDLKVEYQNGRTDQKGRFSFYPSVPGAWRIEAGDGMGHKEVGIIEVQKSQAMKQQLKISRPWMPASQPFRQCLSETITGLSLILNLFLMFYIWKAGKMTLK